MMGIKIPKSVVDLPWLCDALGALCSGSEMGFTLAARFIKAGSLITVALAFGTLGFLLALTAVLIILWSNLQRARLERAKCEDEAEAKRRGMTRYALYEEKLNDVAAGMIEAAGGLNVNAKFVELSSPHRFAIVCKASDGAWPLGCIDLFLTKDVYVTFKPQWSDSRYPGQIVRRFSRFSKSIRWRHKRRSRRYRFTTEGMRALELALRDILTLADMIGRGLL